jgi:hypothetical protein
MELRTALRIQLLKMIQFVLGLSISEVLALVYIAASYNWCLHLPEWYAGDAKETGVIFCTIVPLSVTIITGHIIRNRCIQFRLGLLYGIALQLVTYFELCHWIEQRL